MTNISISALTQKGSEAALLGAAYRAKYAEYLEETKEKTLPEESTILSYHDFIMPYVPNHLERVCEPSKDCGDIYAPMLERYRAMAHVLQQHK